MNQSPYRPLSVWFTQILLALPLFNVLLALLVRLVRCASITPPFDCTSPVGLWVGLQGIVALVPLALAFWGLQTRKSYGQWLGASLLIAAGVMAIAKATSFQLLYHAVIQGQPLPAPPYECWEPERPLSSLSYSCGYNSYAELGLRILADSLPPILLGLLAVRLLCSEAAKRFFRRHAAIKSSVE